MAETSAITIDCRKLIETTYSMQTQTIALTIFSITGGILMRFLHRGKVNSFPFSFRNLDLFTLFKCIVGVSCWSCDSSSVRLPTTL